MNPQLPRLWKTMKHQNLQAMMKKANHLEVPALPAMNPTKADTSLDNGWLIFKDKLFET
jgi:hypothetical protein